MLKSVGFTWVFTSAAKAVLAGELAARLKARPFKTNRARPFKTNHRAPPRLPDYAFSVNARLNKVFCSTSCALADPVAGLALADRFTDMTERPPAIRRNRGSM